MKKLILAAAVAALSLTGALRAGQGTTTAPAAPASCCDGGACCPGACCAVK